MTWMNRCRWRLSLLAGAVALALLGSVGCSRQVGVPTDEGTAQSGQSPFPASKDDSAILPASFAAADNSTIPDTPPFHQPQNLPAGTLLTVRLNAAIIGEKKSIDQGFDAVLDEAVVIGGNTLIPRGAVVTGRVESSRTSKFKPGRGYVRLALQSVRIAGADLPVQTASLFVRPSSHGNASAAATLEKGHRLAFRLTEPVYTPRQTATTPH
jgi:hypothetical protein